MIVQNFKIYLKGVIKALLGRPNVVREFTSYSQAGEDAILNFLIADKKLSRVEYLDLGTNVPDLDNNTYLLYKKGNRGVCVEANKSLIDYIKSVRPEDTILNVGVSVSEVQEADFYVFNVTGINTFDKNEAEKRASSGKYKITEVVTVPLLSVNKIIEDHFNTYPDFLSIDIESLDLEVLRSLDFVKYPIPIICVETCVYSETHIRPKDKEILSFMLTQGYEVYADTYINTIFVNKNWFYKN